MTQTKKSTILIAIGILVLGFIIGQIIIKTSPKAQKHQVKEEATTVTTTTLQQSSNEISIEATGRVQSSKETKLSAQVNGAIVYVAPNVKPGAKVQAGEVLFEIDKINYETALSQSEATLKNAQAQRSLELGQQAIAKKDLQLSGRKLTQEQKSLTLREPQLAIADAQIKDAQARIMKAKSDLEKTIIRAPYDGIIADVPLSLGTMVTTGMSLATIVNNSTLWIFAEVDTHLLEYINFSDDQNLASSVKVKPLSSANDNFFEGHTVSLLPKSQTGSKRPVVLIEVAIPEDRKQTIFDGDLVSVEIQGSSIDKSFLLPWRLLKNDRYIWVYDKGILKIQEIQVLFRHKEHVIVKALADTLEVISSNISNPQEGQKLQKATQ